MLPRVAGSASRRLSTSRTETARPAFLCLHGGYVLHIPRKLPNGRFLQLLLLGLSPLLFGAKATPVPDTYPESPHVEPLALVLATQRSHIASVERPGRTMDTELHGWLVKRPMSSGHHDNRFRFVVAYQIEGKVVAEWTVNTQLRTVTLTAGFFK